MSQICVRHFSFWFSHLAIIFKCSVYYEYVAIFSSFFNFVYSLFLLLHLVVETHAKSYISDLHVRASIVLSCLSLSSFVIHG